MGVFVIKIKNLNCLGGAVRNSIAPIGMANVRKNGRKTKCFLLFQVVKLRQSQWAKRNKIFFVFDEIFFVP
jgi:hypothetical protein